MLRASWRTLLIVTWFTQACVTVRDGDSSDRDKPHSDPGAHAEGGTPATVDNARGDSGSGKPNSNADASSPVGPSNVARDGGPAGRDASTLDAGPELDAGLRDERSLTFGVAGGTLQVGAATLTIPEGALSTDTTIGVRRHGAPDVLSLDDTYELLPDGLHFDVPVSFTLELGEEIATLADDANQRWLGYLLEDGSVLPFTQPVSSPGQGVFSGLLVHFSTAATKTAAGAQSSGPFGELASSTVDTVAHPLSADKCRDLSNQYVPADPDTGQPLAAEINVECQLGAPNYESAPGKGGKVCVRLKSFTAASKSRVDYHDWTDAPAKCKPSWDAFQQKLAAHEAEHLQIGQQICADAFAAVPVPSGGVLGCGKSVGTARANAARAYGELVRPSVEAGQAQQDAIDTGNGHGVNMECGCDECDDPCQVKNPQTDECEPLCKDKCQTCSEGQCEALDCGKCSACDQESGECKPAGGDDPECTPQVTKVYCACNQQCYDDATSCLSECHTSLGCFTGICGPATAEECP